jgi:hypothetical protein
MQLCKIIYYIMHMKPLRISIWQLTSAEKDSNVLIKSNVTDNKLRVSVNLYSLGCILHPM